MGDQNYTDQESTLRQRAEAILRERSRPLELLPEEIPQLVHELRVYQIELELQNEELRSAQERLETSRDRYAELYDFAPVGYLTLDRMRVIREANLTVTTTLQRERASLIGRSFSHLVAPANRDKAYLFFSRLFENLESQRCELELVRPDDTLFYAQIEGVAILDDEGQARRCYVAVIDVSAQKQAERALRQSERKFRAVVEQAHDGVVLCDEEGTIIEWNRAQEQVSGLARSEVLGFPLWRVLFQMAPEEFRTPPAAEQVGVAVGTLLDTGKIPWPNQRQEQEIQRPDGTRCTVEVGLFVIETKDGRMVGALIRDVTQRKRMEAQIRAALREKEVLLEEIHHRVKNNLQVVSSLLDFQAEQVEDERALAALRDSQRRIHSMALVHRRLYESPDLAHIDLADYVRNLAADLLAAHCSNPASPVTLELDLQEVLLDVEQAIPCGLIVNELVSNAFEHAFPGARERKDAEKEVHIELRSDSEGAYVLKVSDNGVGLPPDFRFPGEDSLGLFLVQAFSRQLDGKVEWHAEPGGGTTFQVVFTPHATQSL